MPTPRSTRSLTKKRARRPSFDSMYRDDGVLDIDVEIVGGQRGNAGQVHALDIGD